MVKQGQQRVRQIRNSTDVSEFTMAAPTPSSPHRREVSGAREPPENAFSCLCRRQARGPLTAGPGGRPRHTRPVGSPPAGGAAPCRPDGSGAFQAASQPHEPLPGPGGKAVSDLEPRLAGTAAIAGMCVGSRASDPRDAPPMETAPRHPAWQRGELADVPFRLSVQVAPNTRYPQACGVRLPKDNEAAPSTHYRPRPIKVVGRTLRAFSSARVHALSP